MIAHLNLLQGIVNRLATQSASCKTWCLTLVGALVGLAGATKAPALVPVTLLPVLIFAFMDTMYLAHERAYRELFNETVRKVQKGEYSLADVFVAEVTIGVANYWKSLWSWGVFPVYLGLIVAYPVAVKAGWLNAP